MRIGVWGSNGCIGSAVVRALRWRGHRVVEIRRGGPAGAGDVLALDAMPGANVDTLAERLAALDVDAIVNCAGTALPGAPSARADRLHGDGPSVLFRAAERAGVSRVVNVSALGVGGGSDGWRSKRAADDALLSLALDAVVVRPSLVYGPGSRSGEAFCALARAPVEIVSNRSAALLQPIHVFELAESIAALVERTGAARGVYELGGADVVTSRELLAALRTAQGAPAAHAVVVPTAIARIAAGSKRARSFGVADGGVLRLLERDRVAHRNAATVLLGRAPSTLAEGLLVSPPGRPATAPRDRTRRARWLDLSRGVL